jgi:hypothetical protein
MATSNAKPRVTSFAPQLLVDDLGRSMTWGTKDFYVEDPDGNLIAFGGRPAEK